MLPRVSILLALEYVPIYVHILADPVSSTYICQTMVTQGEYVTGLSQWPRAYLAPNLAV